MKKNYKIYLMLGLILSGFAFNLNAQVNLAPSATTSTSTTGGTAYQWNLINDNNISGCGNQEAFVWTNSPPSNTDNMTWTWSSAKSINKIIFHNSWNNTRNMTGCTVQYWNGSSFSNWYTTATNGIAQACVDSIKFPTVTTTAIRLIDLKMTASGQTSNPSWREIQIISGPSVNVDMGVSQMTLLDICTNTQVISVRPFNYGKKTADSFRLYWSVNGTAQSPVRYITSKLGSAKDTLIVLNASYVLTNNTTYKFKFWTSKPNGTIDSVAANDTLNTTLSFLGNPSPPTTTDIKQCGIGKATLTCIPSSSGDTIMWYDASTSGNLLGIGKTIQSPSINKTTTFYAQALRFGGSVSFNNGYSGGTILSGSYSAYNGGAVDVKALSLVSLDSVTFRSYTYNGNTYARLYYKVGTYVGFETNAAAWTLLFAGKARSFTQNGQYFCRVPATGLNLSTGVTYGFYITTDPSSGSGNDLFAKSGNITVSNTEMSISGGKYIYGLFGTSGLYSPYTMDMEFMSKKTCGNGTRTPLKVTVNPPPIGADLVKGTVYNGQFKGGLVSQPDITAIGKTVSYELLPPTGYTNTNHGSKWIILSAEGRVKNGNLIASNEFTFSNPSGTTNAKLSFTPSTLLCDSVVTFKIKFQDLGPYFCDSTVTRVIKVSPIPKVNFSFPNPVCDGNDIIFNNLTTVGCGGANNGFANYKWYFGDGDSSDLQNPVHLYKTFGCYPVRCVSISSPWGIVKDTTITVCVTEVPTVKFKAINACEGTAVKFVNQTTIGSGTLSYTWVYGDNSANGTTPNPSHLYAVPGGYAVTLKVSANGCQSSLTKNAYQFAKPVSNFATAIAPVCSNTAIDFPNSSTIGLGQEGSYWAYGDGKTSTLRDGYNSYSLPGVYNVKLKSVSEFGCIDSMTKQVTIKPSPTPDFITNKLCSGEPTNFLNTTVETRPNPVYTWTVSDNSSYSTKNITKNWLNEGTYSVSLQAEFDNGCIATTTKDVVVLIQPQSDFSVLDICSGEIANYVNLTKGDKGNINYKWDLGNGFSTEGAPKRLYTPSVTTTYTISLAASYLQGCSDTSVKILTVSQAPICDFTYQNQGFLKYQFTPTNTTYTKYEWFFGEGGTAFTTSPFYTYTYASGFKVRMIATNAAGCKCETTKAVSANSAVKSISAGNGLNIYPNPNTGIFTISTSGANGMRVDVYNLLGSKIMSQVSSENTMNINLGDVSKGIYLVKVTVDGVTTTSKVTVTD